MKFIGEDGNAAPRLKDTAGLDPQDWRRLYIDCVLAMRQMFQLCKLVHGDLSEYNILYDDGKLTIIDVSQSVETDHPHALDFLKRDCVNVNNFFSRRMEGTAIPVKRFFDFVVTRDLPRPDGNGAYNLDESAEALEEVLANAEEGAAGDVDDDFRSNLDPKQPRSDRRLHVP
jgi:RIO kinase 1